MHQRITVGSARFLVESGIVLTKKAEALSPAAQVELPAVQRPVLAELAVAKLPLANSADQPEPEAFHATAVIRVGRLELELTNSVSPRLMQQLKELVSNA